MKVIFLVFGLHSGYEVCPYVVEAFTDEATAATRAKELTEISGRYAEQRRDIPAPEIEDTPENDKAHEKWHRALRRLQNKMRRISRDENMEDGATYSVGRAALYSDEDASTPTRQGKA